MKIRTILAVASLLGGEAALAADYTGNINMLEVWRTGEVAFTIAATVGTCNGQFIINPSWNDAAKTLYAAVLAAKSKGVPIRVITSTCGPADAMPSSSYNVPIYLYVLD
jgi:hypothetical protein